MADYSEVLAGIRSKNEKLKEKERQTFRKREEKEKEHQREVLKEFEKWEEKGEQKKTLIRDKVISYLLEIIKEGQLSGKRVREITLIENKERSAYSIEVSYTDLRDLKVANVIKNKEFIKFFSAQKINRIYEAFGLEYGKSESEALDGFFGIHLKTGELCKRFRNITEDIEEYSLYFLFNEFTLSFYVNY